MFNNLIARIDFKYWLVSMLENIFFFLADAATK